MPQDKKTKYSKLPGETAMQQVKRVGKLLKAEKEATKWNLLEIEAGKVIKEIRKRPDKPNRKKYYGLIKFNPKYDSKREAVEMYKRDLAHWEEWQKSDKK